MSRVGIIAEFNPLHLGHKYLIDVAKEMGEVVCAISGNFVQRGDTAICEKRLRARMALECGADLVVEIPVCYSLSTAQNFALGGVAAVMAAGCDTLLFGSEVGDIEPLLQTADILQSDLFKQKLAQKLKEGITFAKARQLAAEQCGAQRDILSAANNNLGLEYILAARALGADIRLLTVSRVGTAHDSDIAQNGFASASFIRQRLLEGDYKTAEEFMPRNVSLLLNRQNISDIRLIERAILASLRSKSAQELKSLPDLSEGLENKLYSAIKTATTVEQLYENLKVKRYTLARIRRLVLSAFLGLDNTFFMKKPPYIRVLGFNKTGEGIVKKCAKCGEIPLVLRAKEIEGISPKAQKMLCLESKASDLYALSFENAMPCGLEYTECLIKI